jgi:DNA-binding NarL/FixJ family response regulator
VDAVDDVSAVTDSEAVRSDEAMRRVRVVVVDDHEAVRAGLQRLLGRAPGVELLGTFADGHGLFLLLETTSIDVVILDYDLERGDGLSVCLRLKQRPNPPAVAMYSGYAGPGIALAAAAAQADALLSKAEPVDALLGALPRLADGGHMLSEPSLDLREIACSRVRKEDVPVMSMLLDRANTSDIAHALGIETGEAMRRAQRIVGVLQAGRGNARDPHHRQRGGSSGRE